MVKKFALVFCLSTGLWAQPLQLRKVKFLVDQPNVDVLLVKPGSLESYQICLTDGEVVDLYATEGQPTFVKFGVKPRVPWVTRVQEGTPYLGVSESIPVTLPKFDAGKSFDTWPADGKSVLKLTFRDSNVEPLIRRDYYTYLGLWVGASLLGLSGLWGFYVWKIRRPAQQHHLAEEKRAEFYAELQTKREDQKDPYLGEEYGNWVLVSFLGAGGMARVYRALPKDSLDPEQAVALKLMNQDGKDDPEFFKRFERETKVGIELHHPNVVKTIDLGISEGRGYLALEYIDGVPLRQRMKGVLSAEQMGQYLLPLLEALEYVHKQGIVHRDLKPENVMVTTKGRVVLMDFGLAKRGDFSQLTATGSVLGTPAYMSPEQIMGQDLDGRSDQYALGMIAYEMACGRQPFAELPDPIQVIMKTLQEETPPPRKFNPEVDPALEECIMTMLSKRPEERFFSLTLCARKLTTILKAG